MRKTVREWVVRVDHRLQELRMVVFMTLDVTRLATRHAVHMAKVIRSLEEASKALEELQEVLNEES